MNAEQTEATLQEIDKIEAEILVLKQSLFHYTDMLEEKARRTTLNLTDFKSEVPEICTFEGLVAFIPRRIAASREALQQVIDNGRATAHEFVRRVHMPKLAELTAQVVNRADYERRRETGDDKRLIDDVRALDVRTDGAIRTAEDLRIYLRQLSNKHEALERLRQEFIH